jgi:hypothetical protein
MDNVNQFQDLLNNTNLQGDVVADSLTVLSDLDMNNNDIVNVNEIDGVDIQDVKSNSEQIVINTGNITTNTSSIQTNTGNISTNTSNISLNASNITLNTTDITTNTSSIQTNTGNISTNTSNISLNASNITLNTTDITTNTSDITNLQNSVLLKDGSIPLDSGYNPTANQDIATKLYVDNNTPTITGYIKADGTVPMNASLDFTQGNINFNQVNDGDINQLRRLVGKINQGQITLRILNFTPTPIGGNPFKDNMVIDWNFVKIQDCYLDMDGNQIRNLSMPTLPSDGSNKSYTDGGDAILQSQITTNDTDISNLQTSKADISYVDSQDLLLQNQITTNDTDITNLQNSKVNKSGDTMTGSLIISSGSLILPIVNGTIRGCSFIYSPSGSSSHIPIEIRISDIMSSFSRNVLQINWDSVDINQILDMNSNRIENVLSPVNGNDVATKTYVDTGDTALQNSKVNKSGDTMTGDLNFFNNNIVINNNGQIPYASIYLYDNSSVRFKFTTNNKQGQIYGDNIDGLVLEGIENATFPSRPQIHLIGDLDCLYGMRMREFISGGLIRSNIELGYLVANKEIDAGKIEYDASTQRLVINGAGNSVNNKTVEIKDNLVVNNTNNVLGSSQFNGQAVFMSNNFFNGQVYLNNTNTITGLTNFNGQANFNNSTILNSSTQVNGDTQFYGEVLMYRYRAYYKGARSQSALIFSDNTMNFYWDGANTQLQFSPRTLGGWWDGGIHMTKNGAQNQSLNSFDDILTTTGTYYYFTINGTLDTTFNCGAWGNFIDYYLHTESGGSNIFGYHIKVLTGNANMKIMIEQIL